MGKNYYFRHKLLRFELKNRYIFKLKNIMIYKICHLNQNQYF